MLGTAEKGGVEETRHKLRVGYQLLTCADIFWRDVGGFHTNTNKGDNITKKRRRGPCTYIIPLLLLSADHGQEAGSTIEEDQNSHVGDLERRRSDRLLRERNFVFWTFVDSMPFSKSLQGFGRFQNSGYLVGRPRASQNSKGEGRRCAQHGCFRGLCHGTRNVNACISKNRYSCREATQVNTMCRELL